MKQRLHPCPACLGLLLAVLLASSSPAAPKAGVMTFQKAVRDTLDRSARIRLKSDDIHIAAADYRQNLAGLFPRLSMNSRFEYLENLEERQGINSINGEIIGGGSDPWRSGIYFLGQYSFSSLYKTRYDVKYYDKLRDVAVSECEAEAKRLILDMMETFGKVYEGKIKAKYAALERALLHRILDVTTRAKAFGESSDADILKVKTELLQLEQASVLASKALKENMARLFYYTGAEMTETTGVEAFHPIPLDFGSFGGSVKDMPEYRARASEVEARKFRTTGIRNRFLPDISLYGRYDLYGSDPGSLDRSVHDLHDTAYTVGLEINVTLFDAGAQKWARRKSEHELRRHENSLKAVSDEKRRDLRAFQTGYTELSKSLAYQSRLQEQYTTLLAMTRKARELGEKSEIDVLALERDELGITRDLMLTGNQLRYYANILLVETNLNEFINRYYGNWTCQY